MACSRSSFALRMLCFLCAPEARPDRVTWRAFAAHRGLARAHHYFAVCITADLLRFVDCWLLAQARTSLAGRAGVRRESRSVGAALRPLISAQGGHCTHGSGRWPFSERLQAIPVLLTGPSGEPLDRHRAAGRAPVLVESASGCGAPSTQSPHRPRIRQGRGRGRGIRTERRVLSAA